MKERPIIFNGDMVRAILDRRKTQTRRVIKSIPGFGRVYEFGKSQVPGYDWRFRRRGCWNDICDDALCCPYGQPGDRLWIREAFRWVGWSDSHASIAYAADNQSRVISFDGLIGPENTDIWLERIDTQWRKAGAQKTAAGWLKMPRGKKAPLCSPIHMPRWASRIILEITDVRAERVQDISEDDARAEGAVINHEVQPDYDAAGNTTWRPSYREAFAHLWDGINAERGFGWDDNPWVWVVSFKRCE